MSSANPEKQYFVRPQIMLNHFRLVLGVLFFVFFLTLMSGERIDGIVILAYGLLILMCAVAYAILSRLVSLVITADGVELRVPGLKVATTWDNIDSIGTRRLLSEGDVEGLVLRERSLGANGAVRFAALFSYRSTRMLVEYSDFLPVSNILGKDWRNSGFGEELQLRVPHLFEDEGRKENYSFRDLPLKSF